MRIVTTRAQRWTIFIPSAAVIAITSVVFHNILGLVVLLPLGMAMWLLIYWGAKYEDEEVSERKPE